VQYTPRFDRFVLSAKDYSQQYNGVYLARLAQMRASLRYNLLLITSHVALECADCANRL
jgi:hypothetical protein